MPRGASRVTESHEQESQTRILGGPGPGSLFIIILWLWFARASQRFCNLASQRHILAILWPRDSQKNLKVHHRFLNLPPRRHTSAILWPRVSQKFRKGPSKVPQPGALKPYFGKIMASSFPKVSQWFLKGSSTWRPEEILWQ